MAQRIKQFYFKERDPEDEGVLLAKPGEYVYSEIQEGFIDGSIFNGYYPILQLGIQTLPGTRFKLNKSNDYAYIGHSGIFELDLKGQIEVTKLQFYRMSMRNIDENKSAYLIVDIVYDDGED